MSRDLFTKPSPTVCYVCLGRLVRRSFQKLFFCFTSFIAIPAAKIRFGIIAAEFNKLFFYSLLLIVVRSAYEKGYSLVILSAFRTQQWTNDDVAEKNCNHISQSTASQTHTRVVWNMALVNWLLYACDIAIHNRNQVIRLIGYFYGSTVCEADVTMNTHPQLN